jgi:hypothetical protein
MRDGLKQGDTSGWGLSGSQGPVSCSGRRIKLHTGFRGTHPALRQILWERKGWKLAIQITLSKAAWYSPISSV